jgi:hypothetical protein
MNGFGATMGPTGLVEEAPKSVRSCGLQRTMGRKSTKLILIIARAYGSTMGPAGLVEEDRYAFANRVIRILGLETAACIETAMGPTGLVEEVTKHIADLIINQRIQKFACPFKITSTTEQVVSVADPSHQNLLSIPGAGLFVDLSCEVPGAGPPPWKTGGCGDCEIGDSPRSSPGAAGFAGDDKKCP